MKQRLASLPVHLTPLLPLQPSPKTLTFKLPTAPPLTHLLAPPSCMFWSFATSPQRPPTPPPTHFFCFPFFLVSSTLLCHLLITKSELGTNYSACFPDENPETAELHLGPSEFARGGSLLVHLHSGNRITCSSWAFPVPTLASCTWRGQESQLALLGRVSSNALLRYQLSSVMHVGVMKRHHLWDLSFRSLSLSLSY